MTKQEGKGLKIARNSENEIESDKSCSKVKCASPGKENKGTAGTKGQSSTSQGAEGGQPMGLPSEHLLLPSTNGHDNASPPVKTALKRRNSGRQKCRCWCCCCSCSWPSLEEIRGWGESFDKLMRSSGGRKVFRDFLKCEYSEENILFWLACEELKKERIPEVIEEKARLIYEDYISILSPKEVSLDSRVRDVVNQNMRNPKTTTFDEAQLQIYTLMHRDSYPRFVNSPLYKNLAQLNSTPTGSGNPPALPGTSHRGSHVSSTPASRKHSAAS